MSQEIESKTKMTDCPDPEDYSLCSHFIDAFGIIGKKWNGLIISSLCDTNAMRFKDLARCISKCSDRVLVERLIISYTLTQKGADLQPVFEQVHNWADKWA